MIKIRGFLVLLFALPALGLASSSDQKVPKGDRHLLVRQIADQLRCPVCRGIPIAESPSELAQDMMTVIRQKLEEGKSEAEILDYFVARYGEWILLKPKPRGLNLIVWLFPVLFLAGGGFFLAFKIRRWSYPQGGEK